MLGETISAPFCGKMGTTVSAYAASLCRASSVETSNTAKGKGVVTQAKGPVLVVSWDLMAIRGDQEGRLLDAAWPGQFIIARSGRGYLSCEQLSPTGNGSSQVCLSSSRAIHYSTANAVTAPSSCDDRLSQYS